MTFSLIEILIFFTNSSAYIYCLEVISHHIKEILYVNTNSRENKEIKTKRYAF